MSVLRTAVVGVGYLGRFHAQKHRVLEEKSNSQVKLVALVEPQVKLASERTAEFNVPCFLKPEELIGKVDAVTIAAISPLHFELAKLYLENDIHVLVEKPISLRTSEAIQLNDLAIKKKLVLGVGHSERYSTVFQNWKNGIVDANHFEFERHAPYKERGTEVSVILDLMVHDLDLAISLNEGEKPEVIAANAGKTLSATWDWATCTLRWKSGKTAVISSSRLSVKMSRKAREFGRLGFSSCDFQEGAIEKNVLKMGQWLSEALNPGKSDNLLIETEDFINAVTNHSQMKSSGSDAVMVMATIEDIEAKLKSDSQLSMGKH